MVLLVGIDRPELAAVGVVRYAACMKRFLLILLLTASCVFGASIKKGAFMTSTLDDLLLLNRIVAAEDMGALQKMAEAGRCRMIKEDVRVEIVSRYGLFFKVRLKGEINEVWVNDIHLNR